MDGSSSAQDPPPSFPMRVFPRARKGWTRTVSPEKSLLKIRRKARELLESLKKTKRDAPQELPTRREEVCEQLLHLKRQLHGYVTRCHQLGLIERPFSRFLKILSERIQRLQRQVQKARRDKDLDAFPDEGRAARERRRVRVELRMRLREITTNYIWKPSTKATVKPTSL